VSKNQPNDPKIIYNPLSNLVELIGKDLDFERSLKSLKVLLNKLNFWTYKVFA
jgi:hypothetical protein